MAAAGSASKLATDLAYSLFGKQVDYSGMYRTMQSMILNEDEAVAEVVFPSRYQWYLDCSTALHRWLYLPIRLHPEWRYPL